METKRNAGSHSLTGHGLLMLCLGMALSALGTIMTNPTHAELAYGVATALTSLCLVAAAIYLAVLVNRTVSRHSIAIYALALSSAIACWAAFWLMQARSTDLNLLAMIAGLHGLFWGLWYVRLAFHFQSYAGKAVVLCTLAAITSGIGIVLGTWSELSRLSAVTSVACYMSILGIQILLTSLFLHRECEAEKQFAGWQQREVEVHSASVAETPR